MLNIHIRLFVKIFNLFIETSYIKTNIFFIMNFKERGITVGDLLIILLLIVSTTVIVKSFNKDKKSTLNLSDQYKMSYEEILFSKIN